jgi:hypothetical protein
MMMLPIMASLNDELAAIEEAVSYRVIIILINNPLMTTQIPQVVQRQR